MAIPDNSLQLWKFLRNEVLRMGHYLRLYELLYVNEAAQQFLQVDPTFFLIVQEALGDAIELGLARLGEPGKKNLSLATLLKKIEPRADFATRLKKHKAEFDKALGPIRSRRNKLIAHSDSNFLGPLRLIPNLKHEAGPFRIRTRGGFDECNRARNDQG